MASRSARLMTDAAGNILRFFVSMVALFLLTPFMLRHLGARDFGLWSLTFSVLGFFSLLDMGFGTGVVRYVAQCRGAADTDRRNRMVSTLGVIYLLLALTGTLGIALLSLGYNRLFAIPLDRQGTALALLWILAARSVILSLPLGLFQGILFGEQRLAQINIVQIISTLLYSLTAWGALSHHGDVVTLAWISLAAMLVEYLTYAALAFRYVPDLRLSWRLADRRLLREMASFSMAQFIVSIAALVRLRTDPLIVKAFLPLAQVAVYAIALRIAESALLLIKQGVNALAPMVARLHGEGDQDKIRLALLRGSRYAFFGSVLLTVAVCVFAREILSHWVGDAYLGAAPVLIVLMFAMCLVTPQLVAANVLVMTGHHRVTARAEVMGTALNLGVSIALARPLGMVGIALGTLAATVLVDLLVIVRSACQVQNVPAGTYLKGLLLAGILPGAAQAMVTYGVKSALPPANLFWLAVETIPGLICGLIVFWLIGLDPQERQRLTRRAPRHRITPAAKVEQ